MKIKIWILTIGSSDIQLKRNSCWDDWYECLEVDYDEKYHVDFKKIHFKSNDEVLRVPARVLGSVYQNQSEIQSTIFCQLVFPLLENFTRKVRQPGELNQIVLVLTDQSKIFADGRTERGVKSPYWQDTSELLPILKRYFSEQLPNAQVVEPIVLQPETVADSLDNWDSVLELVRQKFAVLNNDLLATDGELEQVYVSHQASTPAISSAVQFMSLSYFGDRVRFLVTSENQNNLKTSDTQENSAQFIESSSYLRGIKKQQARELLKFGNYAAVQELLNFGLSQELSLLLEAAIQWNFAEFDKFFDTLSLIPYFHDLALQRKQLWWSTAYESAYLAVKRLERVDTVEAMFHSFRAVEGLLRKWADRKFPAESRVITIGEKNLNRYGKDLYFALNLEKRIDKSRNLDIWTFGNHVFKNRNDLFHQLSGLKGKESVFQAWKIDPRAFDPESLWKKCVLNCLNFISDQNFKLIDQVDDEDGVASLMVLVHQKLVEEVNEL
ncbi:MAG: hypothetical protein ACAF42_13745 [Limnothrix sp. BL-A-16]